MLLFATAALLALTLSALALRKLWRRQPFLGGDLFWIATTMYLWFLTFAQATVLWLGSSTRPLVDRGWLFGGTGALVLLTLAYCEASWPPFQGPQ
jgi:hypothetical protein